ncbi:MAG TPA: ATP-binding protein [Candidatus Acidoferrales bacterium]|nr:ATP-binding protein [Candidatus Acidoferrales bacterium]
MTLELQATPEEVMRAVEALEQFARAQGVPEKIIFGLMLALEECGSNIVNHGLRRDALRKFQVTIELTHDTFVIELRDRGPAFDPTKAAEREQPKEEDAPGGWGIQLVRRNIDEMQYTRVDGENILRLAKRVGGPDHSPSVS